MPEMSPQGNMEEERTQPRKLGLLMMVSVILAGATGTGVYDISYQIATVASPVRPSSPGPCRSVETLLNQS